MTETIGTCDVCGATDHHLVEGLCPVCRPKTITVSMAARQCGKTFADDPRTRLPAHLDRPLPEIKGTPVNFDCKLRCADLVKNTLGDEAERAPGVYVCDEGDEL